MRIYFIRHAQSENQFTVGVESGKQRGGTMILVLTPLGFEQAKLLGAYLRDLS